MSVPSEKVKFFKSLDVLLSCETPEQLIVAERFAKLAGVDDNAIDILKGQVNRKIKQRVTELEI